MKIKKIWGGIVLGFFLIGLAGVAAATPIDTQYFNDSNTFGEWGGTIPPGYGNVVLGRTGSTLGNNLYFQVSANTNYFTGNSSGLAWNAFFFNYNSNISLTASDIVLVDANFNALSTSDYKVKIDPQRNVSIYGNFDAGAAVTGGNYKLNPLYFYIKNTSSLTDQELINDFEITNSDGYMFAGHLINFQAKLGNQGLTNSTWLGVGTAPNPTPEPDTVLLFAVGLVGLVLCCRRRQITSLCC